MDIFNVSLIIYEKSMQMFSNDSKNYDSSYAEDNINKASPDLS